MIVFLANFFKSKNFSNLILVWVEGGDAVPPEHDGGHLRLRAAAGRVCAQTHRHPLLLPPPRTHAREVGGQWVRGMCDFESHSDNHPDFMCNTVKSLSGNLFHKYLRCEV